MKRLSPALAALALICMTGTANAAVDAHGSVEQVYAIGLTAKVKVALLDRRGRTIRTAKATAEGGVLFRNVKPGGGYQVSAGSFRSDPLTVMTRRSKPPSDDVYNQDIPSSGYSYMTMRDGTKLALDVHPPSDITSAVPLGISLPRA